MGQTYYELLGVLPTASLAEIKKAYISKVKELSSTVVDSRENHILMYKINEAYKTLRNKDLRNAYDEILNNNKISHQNNPFQHLEKATTFESWEANDFSINEQTLFVEWLKSFIWTYINKVHNYYAIKISQEEFEFIEKLYFSFYEILNCEENFLKKNSCPTSPLK